MAFVKLDCGMLDSTIWVDREARELFVTALLMATPHEIREPMETIQVDSLEPGGYTVPVGWYGFVHAAGTGIIARAGMDKEDGIEALGRLSSPEDESRTPDHGGRRMVRVNGGYVVLNFDKYRQKDHTGAERSKRYRERKQEESRVTKVTSRVTPRSVTQAEVRSQKTEATPKKKAAPVAVAPPLPHGSIFAEAWEAWQDHRNEIKHPLKPTMAKAQLKRLGAMSEKEAVEIIQHTVEMGWQGLRGPEAKNGQFSKPSIPRV